MMMMMASVVC